MAWVLVLLLILQRYYFESESQLFSASHELRNRCCLSYKDTILKANHSYSFSLTDILLLLLILQRYYFESESQQGSYSSRGYKCCCLSYKDTILKANHSWLLSVIERLVLLLILQRYYFESESQQPYGETGTSFSCCLSYKDTILKANHSAQSFLVLNTKAVAYPTKILF